MGEVQSDVIDQRATCGQTIMADGKASCRLQTSTPEVAVSSPQRKREKRGGATLCAKASFINIDVRQHSERQMMREEEEGERGEEGERRT